MNVNCWRPHDDPFGVPAVARITIPVTGHTVPFCQDHLDQWFDRADDNPEMEPKAWHWIPGHEPQTAG